VRLYTLQGLRSGEHRSFAAFNDDVTGYGLSGCLIPWSCISSHFGHSGSTAWRTARRESGVWLLGREKLCRLQSPRAFPPEIWWVGASRRKASRVRVGLPIPRPRALRSWEWIHGSPSVGRCCALIHVEGPFNCHGRSALFKLVRCLGSVACGDRAGRLMVNTLKVSQGHERPPVSG